MSHQVSASESSLIAHSDDDPGRISRRVALVTGSATGIGANIAIDLAASGYRVIVTGRNEDNLKRVVNECNQAAGANANNQSIENDIPLAKFFKADLMVPNELDQLVDFVLLNYKQLNVLVNNACWRGKYKHFLECDEALDDFKQVMHLNVAVPLYLIQKCLIPMRLSMKRDLSHAGTNQAVVINISSIASQVVVPLHAYSISKACLSELTRQLARLEISHELGLSSVTISPGPVLTAERPQHQSMSELTLMNRVGTTQEVSKMVLFAITNAELFNGKELNIDGGYVTKQKLPLNTQKKP